LVVLTTDNTVNPVIRFYNLSLIISKTFYYPHNAMLAWYQLWPRRDTARISQRRINLIMVALWNRADHYIFML